MKITLVGVGALGSHVALFLRNEGDLKVIDFDRVEQKNVLAQLHGKPGVGKNKVQSIQQTMNFLFGLKIEGVPHKLVADNVDKLLGDSDLIIDCLDNKASRDIVQAYVRFDAQGEPRKKPLPCLHGALSADGMFGRVVWDENFVIDTEANAGAATCEGGEHLPFIGVVSALLARAAQEFVTKSKKIGFEVHPGGVTRT